MSPTFTGQLTSRSSHVSHLDSIVLAFLVLIQGKSSDQIWRNALQVSMSVLE